MYLLIPLRPSRMMHSIFIVQCLLALSALFWADPPPSVLLGAVCVFTLLCLVYWLREPVRAIAFSESAITLSYSDRNVAVRMHRQCVCSPYLIVLRLRHRSGSGERRGVMRFLGGDVYLLILPDSCPRELQRRLRVALRWQRFDEHCLLH